MCKKKSLKRMRVYRRVSNRYRKASRDFVYVVSADDYRNDLENVHSKLIELSQKVMDEDQMVKNREYIEKMDKIEEDLLMNHGIEMNWFNGKSVNFKKIIHVCRDPETLSVLDEVVKENKMYDKDNPFIERFRMGAKLEECGIRPPYNWDWHDVNLIVKKGHVICAYSRVGLRKIKGETFKVGFFDKFGYNLGICTEKSIEDVIKRSREMDAMLEAEAMASAV